MQTAPTFQFLPAGCLKGLKQSVSTDLGGSAERVVLSVDYVAEDSILPVLQWHEYSSREYAESKNTTDFVTATYQYLLENLTSPRFTVRYTHTIDPESSFSITRTYRLKKKKAADEEDGSTAASSTSSPRAKKRKTTDYDSL
jgi:hypothetical protein